MPIDHEALARSVERLGGVDPAATGLDEVMRLVVDETVKLFAVDGAGLLLLADRGVLRYVTASDEVGRALETMQERTGEGPCVDAVLDDATVAAADLTADPRWPRVGRLAGRQGIRAVLGVPVDLEGGPVGSLNVYSTSVHDWDETEVAAIEAYARVIATLLQAASDAHLKGRAAEQLQRALDSRVLIEQAKGILMERHRVDGQAAFDLLRRHARSSRRPLADISAEVVAGKGLGAPTG